MATACHSLRLDNANFYTSRHDSIDVATSTAPRFGGMSIAAGAIGSHRAAEGQ